MIPRSFLFLLALGGLTSIAGCAPTTRSTPPAPRALNASDAAAPESAASACSGGRELVVVAHPDDDLLFMNPDVLAAIRSGACVRSVYVTAGDAGRDRAYWAGREQGILRAYALLANVHDAWIVARIDAAGRNLEVHALKARRSVEVVFLRLPDGLEGAGSATYDFESIGKLWASSIAAIETVDDTSRFTRGELVDVIRALAEEKSVTRIRTLDWTASGFDHPDHVHAARFAEAAQRALARRVELVGYRGYNISDEPENVFGGDLSTKTAAFLAYSENDDVMRGHRTCAPGDGGFCNWLHRQYRVRPARGVRAAR